MYMFHMYMRRHLGSCPGTGPRLPRDTAQHRMGPPPSDRTSGALFRSVAHSTSPRSLSEASELERNELIEPQPQMGSGGRTV